MFKFITRAFASSSVQTAVQDQLYETQRAELVHAAAAEYHQALVDMCLKRSVRLNASARLNALAAPVRLQLFVRTSVNSLVLSQLRYCQREYLTNLAATEHHSALATMFKLRAARLQRPDAGLSVLLPKVVVGERLAAKCAEGYVPGEIEAYVAPANSMTTKV